MVFPKGKRAIAVYPQSRTRWLTPEEVGGILFNHESFVLSRTLPHRPESTHNFVFYFHLLRISFLSNLSFLQVDPCIYLTGTVLSILQKTIITGEEPFPMSFSRFYHPFLFNNLLEMRIGNLD